MTNAPQDTQETPQRLLEAAGEIFAEQGFRAATIREICERAKANVAAVNYYFGDKQALYNAVIRHWFGVAIQKYPPGGEAPDDAPAEQRLRAFIRSFLFRILDQGRPAWHGKLMAHEMTEPTRAMDELVEAFVRPMIQRLDAILRELVGPGIDAETLRLCGRSIVGQCLFYNHARPVLERMGQACFRPEDIEHLAEHVARFSLAALREIAREGGRAAP